MTLILYIGVVLEMFQNGGVKLSSNINTELSRKQVLMSSLVIQNSYLEYQGVKNMCGNSMHPGVICTFQSCLCIIIKQVGSSNNASALYSGGGWLGSTRTPTIPTQDFYGFPQSVQAHARIST
jgi:hypothetical protein